MYSVHQWPIKLYTQAPQYLANLVQWHTPCRTLRSASANLLSATRCNISFGARGFRSAATAIWNSLPLMSVLVKLLTTTHHSWHLIFSTQPFPLPSDPSQRLWFVHDHGALIYLLTYLLTYIIADDLEWPRRSFQQLQTFISLISRQMYTKN